MTRPTHAEVMSKLDAWVANHPWARGGYVPEDLVTADHGSVFPGEVNQGPEVFAIQQVRSEISELIECVLRECPNFETALEIGMGNCGGTRMIWKTIFDKVITIELNRELVAKYKAQAAERPRDRFVLGDSTSYQAFVEARTHANLCSLLFIDGDHTLEGVSKDYETYKDLVCDKGLIVFHDTQVNGPPNIMVRQFVDHLESTGKKMTHIRHSRTVGISYMTVHRSS